MLRVVATLLVYVFVSTSADCIKLRYCVVFDLNLKISEAASVVKLLVSGFFDNQFAMSP